MMTLSMAFTVATLCTQLTSAVPAIDTLQEAIETLYEVGSNMGECRFKEELVTARAAIRWAITVGIE